MVVSDGLSPRGTGSRPPSGLLARRCRSRRRRCPAGRCRRRTSPGRATPFGLSPRNMSSPLPPSSVSLPKLPTSGVVAVAAVHDIVRGAAEQLVVAVVAVTTSAPLAGREVVAGAGADRVGAVLAADPVVAVAAEQRVVAARHVHATALPEQERSRRCRRGSSRCRRRRRCGRRRDRRRSHRRRRGPRSCRCRRGRRSRPAHRYLEARRCPRYPRWLPDAARSRRGSGTSPGRLGRSQVPRRPRPPARPSRRSPTSDACHFLPPCRVCPTLFLAGERDNCGSHERAGIAAAPAGAAHGRRGSTTHPKPSGSAAGGGGLRAATT